MSGDIRYGWRDRDRDYRNSNHREAKDEDITVLFGKWFQCSNITTPKTKNGYCVRVVPATVVPYKDISRCWFLRLKLKLFKLQPHIFRTHHLSPITTVNLCYAPSKWSSNTQTQKDKIKWDEIRWDEMRRTELINWRTFLRRGLRI